MRKDTLGALILALLPTVVRGGDLIADPCKAAAPTAGVWDQACNRASCNTNQGCQSENQCNTYCDTMTGDPPSIRCDKAGCAKYFDLKALSSYCTALGEYGDSKEDNQGQCKSCGKGRWGASAGLTSNTACTGCAKGKFGTTTGMTSAATSCTGTCSEGKYGDTTGRSVCSGCSGGRWSSTAPIGGTGLTSNNDCTSCIPGRWSAGTGKSTNTCQNCSAGRYEPNSGNSGNSQCNACAAGRFGPSTGATASSQCTGVCSAGRFEDTSGKSSNDQCNERCSVGRFSIQTALISDTQCEGRCPRGKFGTAEGTTSISTGCTAFCSAGKWSNSTGLSSDAECPWCLAGRFSNKTGLTAPHQCSGRCSAGRFGVGFVAVIVTDPAGCVAPLSRITNKKECRRLARGLSLLPSDAGYDVDSVKVPTPAPVSASAPAPVPSPPHGCSAKITGKGTLKTYVVAWTSSSAKKCGENGFKCICKYNATTFPTFGDYSNSPSTDAHCIGRCIKGKWSNETGLTSDGMCAGRCSPGRYSNKTGLASDEECAGFPQGRWGREIGQRSTVAAFDEKRGLAGPCIEGRWSNRTGLSAYLQCTECAVGRFSSRIAATSACNQSCPSGRWSGATGLSSAAQCNVCTGGMAGNCSECLPGKFIFRPKVCVDCFAGKFTQFAGATVCTDCEAGRYSKEGASGCFQSVTCDLQAALLRTFFAALSLFFSLITNLPHPGSHLPPSCPPPLALQKVPEMSM